MKRSIIALLFLGFAISSWGQKPKQDSIVVIKFEMPLVEWNKSVDSVNNFAIPAIGERMYSDEQRLFKAILIRQFNKYLFYSKLDTVITKK